VGQYYKHFTDIIMPLAAHFSTILTELCRLQSNYGRKKLYNIGPACHYINVIMLGNALSYCYAATMRVVCSTQMLLRYWNLNFVLMRKEVIKSYQFPSEKSHFDVKICRFILAFFQADILQLFQSLERMLSYEKWRMKDEQWMMNNEWWIVNNE
jgi:hypothetical protein